MDEEKKVFNIILILVILIGILSSFAFQYLLNTYNNMTLILNKNVADRYNITKKCPEGLYFNTTDYIIYKNKDGVID